MLISKNGFAQRSRFGEELKKLYRNRTLFMLRTYIFLIPKLS